MHKYNYKNATDNLNRMNAKCKPIFIEHVCVEFWPVSMKFIFTKNTKILSQTTHFCLFVLDIWLTHFRATIGSVFTNIFRIKIKLNAKHQFSMEMIETYIILLVYVTKVIDTNCPPNDNPEL